MRRTYLGAAGRTASVVLASCATLSGWIAPAHGSTRGTFEGSAWTSPALTEARTIGLQDPAQDAAPAAEPVEEQEPATPQDDAETDSPSAPGDAPTLEQIRAKLESIRGDDTLDAERKQRLIELYRQAEGHLEKRASMEALSTDATESAEGAPAALEEVRQGLQAAAVPLEVDASHATPLAELEKGLAEARRALTEARNELAAHTKSKQTLTNSRSELPAQDLTVQTGLREVEAALERPDSDESSLEDAALRAERLTRLSALRAEAKAIADQLATLDTRLEVTIEREDLGEREVDQLEAYVEAWSALVTERRDYESRSLAFAAQRARARVDGVPEPLKPLASENADLAQAIADAAAEADRSAEELDAVRARLDEIEAGRGEARARVQLEGDHGMRLSAETGALLRRQLGRLPDKTGLEKKANQRWRDEKRLALEAVRRRSAADELEEDLDARIVTALAESEVTGPERVELERDARTLLTERVTLLESLAGQLRRHGANLADLGSKYEEFAKAVGEFVRYIERHVLWIVSGPPIWATDFSDLPQAAAWLFDPRNWKEAFRALGRDISEGLKGYGFVFAAVGWLLVKRRRMRAQLAEYGEAADPGTCTSMTPTWRALWTTFLLILPGPLLFRWIGWRLSTRIDAPEFTFALGQGLRSVALLVMLIEIPRQILRPGGLGEKHFEWTAHGPRSWRSLTVMVVLLPVFAAATVMFNTQTVGDWQPSAERICLLLALATLALGSHFVMHARRERLGVDRWRMRAVHIALVGVPTALAVLAVVGYLVTAVQLGGPVIRTIVVVFLAISAHSFVHRWLLITRRAARVAQRQEQSAAEGEGADDAKPSPQIDLEQADLQTRRMFDRLLLIASVVWLLGLWSDILSLGGLQETTLWQVQGADGRPVDVTLAALLGSLVGLLITLISARNLPGVLDLLLLRKLPIRPGDRLLVGTVARYLILLAGVTLSLNALELRWTQMQWMAAALSVGLGFGLQEIFANFVSGVILLFERPIRIGDLVTVGNVDGRVTNINLRATTITDFDRRELIVPNKAFVTGQLVNWTLSDNVTRVVFPVQVSRRSDPTEAQRVLTGLARRNPLVMRDPAPDVVFMGFTEDAMKFDLRVFIAERAAWADLLNTLNLAIHTEFEKEGLEIAARYQELHVKSADGLADVLGRTEGLSIEELGPSPS